MSSNTETPVIDALVRAAFEELKPPGLVCAVTADRKIRHVAAYGVCDAEHHTPFDVHIAFPIGSLTKSFAAAALLILRDEQKLSLDQSPRDFAPELSSYWQDTSLFQLLSMQSGLGEDFGGSWAEQHLVLSNAELTHRFAVPVTRAVRPGTHFFYSNFGYMVLGRVISQAAGQDARDFIAQRLLEPLEMSSTSWSIPQTNTALGYKTSADRFEQEERFSASNDGAVFGGLWSCLSDMARWIDFLACAHKHDDETYALILARAARLEMQRAVTLRPVSPARESGKSPVCLGYGFGLVNFPSSSEWAVGHGGAVPGFGCHMRWSPNTGIGLIAVANIRYADLSESCGRILTAATEKEPARAQALHPLVAARASVLLALLREWDIATAEQLFTFNFFIDYPREDTAKRFTELGERYAENLTDAQVLQLRGLSAKIMIRGSTLLTFTVSSLEPNQVQEVTF